MKVSFKTNPYNYTSPFPLHKIVTVFFVVGGGVLARCMEKHVAQGHWV